MANRKKRRDERADDAADGFERVEFRLQRGRCRGDDEGEADDDGRMAEREEKADADRALAFLHQLARHIVDGGDVIRVEGVPEAEAVGEKGGPEQQREIAEGDERPHPRGDVGGDQQDINADDLAAHILFRIVEQGGKAAIA